MAQDELIVEVLDDGTVKISSPGSVSSANHSSAEEAFKYIAAQMGGESKREKIQGAKTHHHHHGHNHVKQ